MLTPLQVAMINEARKRNPNIRPCTGKVWKQCFGKEITGKIYLCYNDENDSTLVIREKDLQTSKELI